MPLEALEALKEIIKNISAVKFCDVPQNILVKLQEFPISDVKDKFVKYKGQEFADEYTDYRKTHKFCKNCKRFSLSKAKFSYLTPCGYPECEEYYNFKLASKVVATRETFSKKTQEQKAETTRKAKETWANMPKEKLEERKRKAEETNLKKYGAKSYTQTTDFKEKSKEFWGNISKEKIRARTEKIQTTYFERTGYKTPSQNPALKKKMVESSLKKYGVRIPSQSQVVKDKHTQTCLKKYGVKSFTQTSEFKEKVKNTSLKKYGTESPNQAPCVKIAQEQGNLKKYGYKKAAQSPDIKLKVKENYLIKMGVENNSQTHIKNYENYNCKDFWIENFGEAKNNILYVDIDKICDYFNIYPQAAYQHLKYLGIEYTPKRHNIKTQQKIFDSLDSCTKVLNARGINTGELDIYLPENNLAIEYNGLLYHSQGISEYSKFNTPNFDKNYHLQKTLECKSLGIQLFHIFEGENIDLWLSMINNKLGLNTRIYARNCFAEELRNSDCKSFLEENHLQGFSNAKIAIGLYHSIHSKNSTKVQGMQDLERKLVAVMTFGKPRFSKGYDYELIRFCSLKGYNIIGGASKLWKFFLKKYNPKSVVSYANLRFSNGGLYEKLGFSLKNQSSPNYFYFHPKDMILYPRIKFQKHKLSKLLDIFDENKSEVENMFANGYRRIYDCGNLVYEFTNK